METYYAAADVTRVRTQQDAAPMFREHAAGSGDAARCCAYARSMVAIAVLMLTATAFAKIDLVTLPSRDSVQLTIYNSADMTLVRDGRSLTLVNGMNKLQFSWANTLIDPTSLELVPKKDIDKIDVLDLEYPARVRELGAWNVKSGVAGDVPVEITYLTSGLNWRAFYLATLAHDEKTMRLEGYVRVTNGSGEDYENAQTRLIVGKVHMIEEIAALARQQQPYGRPGLVGDDYSAFSAGEKGLRSDRLRAKNEMLNFKYDETKDKKQIVKEGLSEYFLYTIEGTETIANGWSKRLPSFDVSGIPVTNLYKYDEERYGKLVVRFLSFKNSTTHKLGQTPIPDGMIKVCRTEDAAQHLSYQGSSSFKYIPVDEEVELNLGAVANVTVEPTLMDFKTLNHQFDRNGNVCGWDEMRRWDVKIANTRAVPVNIEITCGTGTPKWSVDSSRGAECVKHDATHIRFSLTVPAGTKTNVVYAVTTRHGTRE